MPTTSNFGWTTPADTDLVKDGAAAIRTLGNGIDTSFIDLKGGTTGQVLSKASNTDLDYSWVTPNVGDITEVQAGTGISVASGTGPIPVVTNTVATAYDAKGDLIVGTGADTFAKLSVGTNDYILVADSSTSTGLKWAPDQKGSFIRITTNTFSAQSSVILSSCFTSTYDNYFMILNVTQSGSNNIFLRLRNGSTDYTTADQRAGSYYSAWNTSIAAAGATNLDHIFQFSGTNPINSSYFFYNPYASKTTMANGCRIDSGFNQSTFYCANNTNSYDSLNLSVDAGTITGEISIYGIVRS